MSDNEVAAGPDVDLVAELRARANALERRLAETEEEAKSSLILAELKVEAVRAGMVDLDGLKLLDIRNATLTANGDFCDAAQLIAQFRRAKPWLFAGASSSSPSIPPPIQPPRQKLATEMTDAEYRTARAALLKTRP
jgi:hypothetical protein